MTPNYKDQNRNTPHNLLRLPLSFGIVQANALSSETVLLGRFQTEFILYAIQLLSEIKMIPAGY
jgi:hypothetical protein